MSEVLSTCLYLPFGSRKTTREAAERSLIQDLLCYDRVVVLTDHMAAAGMLAGMMGADAFEEALELGAFRFLHDRQVIAWPKRPGYTGASPITPIVTVKTDDNDGGLSHASASLLAGSAIVGFGWGEPRTRALADLVAKYAVDFDWPPKKADPTAKPWADAVLDEVRGLRSVVMEVKLPVKLEDLNRLSAALKDPRKSPLRTKDFGIITNNIETGWPILESKAAVTSKQLGMIHLAVADRFLLAHQAVPDAVLHTEPIVENILAARTARIRSATGGQVDVILEHAEVNLPVLTAAGDVPYSAILRSRSTPAARAFRAMVQKRDIEGVRTLMQEYLLELHQRDHRRFGEKVARWLTGTVLAGIGGAIPGGDAVLSAIDKLLIDQLRGRRTAAFYVDSTLRRIASGADVKIKVRE